MTRMVRKAWGKEVVLVDTELYCAKILTCRDDVWSSGGMWHYHPVKDETFRVLEGMLELELGEAKEGGVKGKTHILTKGQVVRIRPGVLHRFRSPGCKFLEVSTRDDAGDAVRVEHE